MYFSTTQTHRITTLCLVRARLAVSEQLGMGVPTLQSVARQLALSTRTLQRRLRNAGQTFQQLVDEARYESALALARDNELTTADIAYRLGYSDPSPFQRAFKRWHGDSLKSYRANS